MTKTKLYLKLHKNGFYYVHWTDGRIGKRKTTKSRDRAEAQEFLRKMREGQHDRTGTIRESATPKEKSPAGTRIRFLDDAEIMAIQRDPIGYSLKKLVDARSKLTVLMLRYENAVLTNRPASKLRVLRVFVHVARAELSRELCLYQDTMAERAGEPLSPPDCDSVLWPRRDSRVGCNCVCRSTDRKPQEEQNEPPADLNSSPRWNRQRRA